jgi:hypothetical protein
VWLPHRVLPARWFRGRPLALEMLRAGHGTVYAQAGAEYGAWGKDKFLAVEAQARYAPRPRPSIYVWVLTGEQEGAPWDLGGRCRARDACGVQEAHARDGPRRGPARGREGGQGKERTEEEVILYSGCLLPARICISHIMFATNVYARLCSFLGGRQTRVVLCPLTETRTCDAPFSSTHSRSTSPLAVVYRACHEHVSVVAYVARPLHRTCLHRCEQ